MTRFIESPTKSQGEIHNLRRTLLALFLVLTVSAAQSDDRNAPLIADYVKTAVKTVPASLALDPFYAKHVDALGIAVVSSKKAPDSALLVARDIIIHMLAKRPDLREAMIKEAMRVIVMARSESTTDLPEQRDWKKPTLDDPRLTLDEKIHYDDLIGKLTDKQYWDRRARGMGGNPTSCAEENLLGFPGTRYYGENILVHEFAHGIMDIGIRSADQELLKEIRSAYKQAMSKGLWKGHYAATNANEYWAEGTQTWFWSNYEYVDKSQIVDSPDDLKRYDPSLYALLARVYPDHHIPMDVYHAKAIDRVSRNLKK